MKIPAMILFSLLSISTLQAAENIICAHFDKDGKLTARIVLDAQSSKDDASREIGDGKAIFIAQSVDYFIASMSDGGKANRVILPRDMVLSMKKATFFDLSPDANNDLVCYNMKESEKAPFDADYKAEKEEATKFEADRPDYFPFKK